MPAFGGSVSALRLSEKGYSVAVIEMGKRWRAEDFPKSTWDVRKYFWHPPLGLHARQLADFPGIPLQPKKRPSPCRRI